MTAPSDETSLDGKHRPRCSCCNEPMHVAEWVCFNVEEHDRLGLGVQTVIDRTFDDE